MPDVIGIDHIYIAVANLQRSEAFYDVVMPLLGFRKNTFVLAGEPHVQYFNRHLGYVLRPARISHAAISHAAISHADTAYAPGLHHLCWRVDSSSDVAELALQLQQAGIAVTAAESYPEYAPDYVACFLSDPDGIRLEITNYRLERRDRHDHW